MQATTIGGIAGAIVGLGGAAAIHWANRDKPQQSEDAARAEWTAWKAHLDREFPDRSLTGPGDEARFEAFLKEHPAPDFLHVEYEHLRAISIDPFDPVSGGSRMGGTMGVAAIGAGLLAGFAGASVAWSSRFPSAVNGLGAFGQLAGGTLGLGIIAGSFFSDHPTKLLDEIEASEWHTPSSWTD